ncbi:MAG: hypothetical protein ACYDBP_03605 [Leptospirales bacterium]
MSAGSPFSGARPEEGRGRGSENRIHAHRPILRIIKGKALLGIDFQKGLDKGRRLFEEARIEAEMTGALWYGLEAEIELALNGGGETKRMGLVLARLSGGGDLEPVRRARGLPGRE